MIPSVELQKAIYESLDEGIYQVYEVVPNVDRMPLITLGSLRKSEDFTKTNTNRFTFSITIHGWSIGKSSVESKMIEEFIYQSITELEMDDYDVEFVRLAMNENLKEEETDDRVIFHSIQEFEITIKKN